MVEKYDGRILVIMGVLCSEGVGVGLGYMISCSVSAASSHLIGVLCSSVWLM